MWMYPSALLKRFAADKGGATMLIFALTLVPMLIGMGLAVDYSRALITQSRLGQAIDSAALAVGSWTDLTDEEIREKAQTYFDANFPSAALGSPGPLDVDVGENTITISVQGEVETTFMSLAGIDEVAVEAFTEVTKNEKQIELVMVLDNTGSMAWSGKLDALKDASNALLDVLMPEGQSGGVYEDIKIGLVPFAAGVNIGADKLNSGWIDVDGQSSIAGEDFDPESTNVLDLYADIQNGSWNGCVRARPEPYDTQDTPPSAGEPEMLWVPYFAPDEPDFHDYANRYADDGDWDDDFEGDWDDEWDARQRYTGKYVDLTMSGWGDGPDYNCRVATVTPLSSVRADVVSAIDDMVATGNTVIPAGLAWGWRLISPGEPYTEGAPYDQEDVIKAVVLLTDGQNDVGGGADTHNRSQYSAYGFARSGHMGAENGSEAEEVLDQKTATLCDNIKSNGVRLYTITFQLWSGSTKDLMRDCASSPEMYYDSPTNSELETVFQDIAKGLSELRLSK